MKWVKKFYEGKDVGLIRSDGLVFMKIVYPQHIFRKFNGVGISEGLIDELKERGVVQIRIVYKKGNNEEEIYRVSIDEWIKEGIPYTNIEKGRDGKTIIDEQLILPFEKMVKEG